MSEQTEAMARALHARRCRFYGIINQFQIDMYWDGCDQNAYRRRAEERLTSTTLPDSEQELDQR